MQLKYGESIKNCPAAQAAGLSQEVENLVVMGDWPKTVDIAVFARRSFDFAGQTFAEAISRLPNQEIVSLRNPEWSGQRQ